MRVTTKGQVTIPAEIREKAGLLPHTDVEFIFDGRHVRIMRKPGRTKETAAHAWRRICADAATSP